MDVKNDQDLMTLFDRLTHGGMKDSIQAEVLRKQGEGLVLKERRYRGDLGRYRGDTGEIQGRSSEI